MQDSRMILVVEDDDTLRLLIRKQLIKLGFKADTVPDGSEAVTKITGQENSYALILMDIQMPKMDGFEATSAIREFEKNHNRGRQPIIAVTANPDRQRCLDHGMDDFIFKPVMIEQLQALLNRWIPCDDEVGIGASAQSTKLA